MLAAVLHLSLGVSRFPGSTAFSSIRGRLHGRTHLLALCDRATAYITPNMLHRNINIAMHKKNRDKATAWAARVKPVGSDQPLLPGDAGLEAC